VGGVSEPPVDLEFHDYDTRLAAYAVVVDEGRILLAWWNGEGHSEPAWTLPGGGVDLPETADEGAIREVLEETGLDVELTGLLAVDSHIRSPDRRRLETDRWVRFLRIVYSARVVGGVLGTLEVDGSTDHAAWVALDSVPDLSRTPLVDIGVAAWTSERAAARRPS